MLCSAIVALALAVPPGNPDLDPDRDGDGLSDFHEIHKHLTDPDKADSDGDGVPDGDWHERREYQYTVRSVVHVLKPVTPEYLTDDYQDARVLDETDTYFELEVIHYPFNTVADAITADPDWQRTARTMEEWLEPGPSSDWTPKLRSRIRKDMKAAGIDFGKLDDKELVERASRFLMERAEYHDGFSSFITAFDARGRPYIPDYLQNNRSDKELKEQWDREVSAAGMYENKSRGSCTSSAIYLNGCMRAVGIPTRTVLCIPVVDANDDRELEWVQNNIQHPEVRAQLMAALNKLKGSWASHTFNEVFVGGRWRRLNYERLGQGIYDRGLYGLITHVGTFRDWADANAPETIGRRQKGERIGFDVFGGPNPYSAISLRDQFGEHCAMQCPDDLVYRVQVKDFVWTDSKALPEDIRNGLEPKGRFGLVAAVEYTFGRDLFQAFCAAADHRLYLHGKGDQRLSVAFNPGCMWYGDSSAWVYVPFGPADREGLKRGQTYSVTARNQVPGYVWEIEGDERVTAH